VGVIYAAATDFSEVGGGAVIWMTVLMIVGSTSDLWTRLFGLGSEGSLTCGTIAASTIRAIAGTFFIPAPLFLVGIFQLVPILWLNLLVGLPALAYTVFLLYVGIPAVMEIPAERGFLFASAVLAVGLVGLVGLLAVTVILWGIGIGPVFTH